MSDKKLDRYHIREEIHPCDISGTVLNKMVPSFDGVKLHTAVYFPEDFKGKSGVVLVRTPYCPTTALQLPDPECLKKRLIFVIQSCRGTGWSEGVFDPAEEDIEKRDAENLLKWLSSQSWFNGRCVMTGSSYSGWCQWAAGFSGCPELTGIAPRVAPLWGCTGSARPGGNMALSFSLHWSLLMFHRRKYGFANDPDFFKMGIMEHLPVLEADCKAGYGEVEPLRKFLRKINDPGKSIRKIEKEFQKIQTPAYISGGWFDLFKQETFQSFQLMKTLPESVKARNFTRLIIGPWGHQGLLNPELFGKKNNWKQLEKRSRKFLYSLLKSPGKDPLPNEPAVKYFMLGENKWYEAESWPPQNVKNMIWHLNSKGHANTLSGDGFLSQKPPEETDLFDSGISNPEKPVPSDLGKTSSPGCYDRSSVQERNDVLVFTSEPMKEPLSIAGEVKVRFSAEVSTPDTDFFATLTDVAPDGKAYFLTQGMIRARYRNSPAQPELLIPGKKYEFEINLSHIAVSFLPGHSIRLDLCGQDFPSSDRNLNTGNDPLNDTEIRCSEHKIFYGKNTPAVLILPVLP